MRLILILLLTINLLQAKKLALVMGNSDYAQGFLPNPTKDADLIAKKLKSVGFSVTLKKNIKTAYDMEEVINDFARTLKKDDIAVVYYAGHGVQCNGKNYLMPTKANVARGGQLKSKAVDLDFLTGGVSDIKLAIVMLDACRNNTFPSCGRTRSRGLVQPNVESNGGMIISFATASNQIALDGNGNHSPYALALTEFMGQAMPIETYFRKVGGKVFSSSEQRPMLKNSFYGSFSFATASSDEGDKHDMRDIVKIENLMYQNQPFTKRYTWKEAKGYCQSLTLGGYSGWRLPTRAELNKISNVPMYGKYDDNWKKWFYKNKHKRLKGSKAKERFVRKEFLESMKTGSSFWTSETYEKDSSYAWGVSFLDGRDLWYVKTRDSYALCVR